jgi:hypothetical protein
MIVSLFVQAQSELPRIELSPVNRLPSDILKTTNGQVMGDPVIRGKIKKILEQHGLNEEVLKQQGQKLMIGELTGAGKTLSLEKLEYMIDQNQLIPSDSIDLIQFDEKVSFPNKISHIKSIQYLGDIIEGKQIIGIIVKQ